MKRIWLLVAAATLLALSGVVLATFPAAVAWRWWGERVPDLKLQGISGTVWNGTATRVAVRGQMLGRMDWQVPFWALVRGAPSVRVDLSGPGLKLKAVVARHSADALALSELNAEAEAGWLGPALAIPELEPTGLIVTENARLVLTRSGMPQAIDAAIEWRNAGVRGQVVARLGTILIQAHGSDGRIQASSIDQGNYRSETILVPRVEQGPIVEALQWVGVARPAGGRQLIVEGRITVLEESL